MNTESTIEHHAIGLFREMGYANTFDTTIDPEVVAVEYTPYQLQDKA
jgi:hypothetical protein